jgi:hypothetical protein
MVLYALSCCTPVRLPKVFDNLCVLEPARYRRCGMICTVQSVSSWVETLLILSVELERHEMMHFIPHDSL